METNRCQRPQTCDSQNGHIMKHPHQLNSFNLYCIIDLEPIVKRGLFWGGAALWRGWRCGNKSATQTHKVVWQRTSFTHHHLTLWLHRKVNIQVMSFLFHRHVFKVDDFDFSLKNMHSCMSSFLHLYFSAGLKLEIWALVGGGRVAGASW